MVKGQCVWGAVAFLPDAGTLAPSKQIFVKDKANYYDIADNAPHIETY
ncbi:MAG: hypothetical protein AAFP98_04010 [Pseudomonadota bacterium]